ncbi:MAG TPA: DUF1697 domain-containing protein [Acidimicrobiia bacterium]|jgi:uncharacterized protein (DUF1697 family)
MPTWIALLRGVNVGKGRKLPMADLRAALEGTSCTNVTTYIQSGNVVLDHPKIGRAALQSMLERTIEKCAGFEVPVVLRSGTELGTLIADNPYPRVDAPRLHVAFLAAAPRKSVVDAIDRDAFAPETFVVAGPNVYLHLPNGMGKSKLGQRLSVFGTSATVRNWNTVLQLRDLSRR